MANPNFKGGRYSKVLPQRLLARYAEAASDSELLAMREEIQLLDARLADVLSRVDTGESGTLWSQARSVYRELREAMTAGDAAGTRIQLAALEDYLGRGVEDWSAWNEVKSLLSARKAMVESERKRMIEMQQMVSSEQVMVLIAALTDSIRSHVTDRNALAGISNDLVRILGTSSSGEHPARRASAPIDVPGPPG